MVVLCLFSLKKLRILKTRLKDWNHNVFGNFHGMVKQAEGRVSNIQLRIQDSIFNDELRVEDKYVIYDLRLTLHRENLFRKENVKVNLHLDGDRNIKFFHRMDKKNNTTKSIYALIID